MRNVHAEVQVIEGCLKGASHTVSSFGSEDVNTQGTGTIGREGGEDVDIVAVQRLGRSRQDVVSR
ncbi:MAG: hypothetical protein ACREJN_06795 [Nitrospiraceae bacterium]